MIEREICSFIEAKHQLKSHQLLQLKSERVKKFIVSIGTNDLLQLPQSSNKPKKAAPHYVP